MDPVYMFLHIPRTGGTSFEKSINKWNSRDNDDYLKHYHYVQSWSEIKYDESLIPKLNCRTTEQQKQIKVMSGHSIFCNSHRWLKVRRTPRLIANIRNPIERLLSSFNMRHTTAIMCQDRLAFSGTTPHLGEWAMRQEKIAADYDTLFEFYQDAVFEQNLQCKWLIKSFVKYDGESWGRHPIYVFGPDTGIPVSEAVPMTWPEWMFSANEMFSEVDWFNFAENFFPEIWWLSNLDDVDETMPNFCKHVGLDYNPSHDNSSKLKYWTIDEVMKQPDIDKLIEAEKYDFKLYEASKNWRLPF